MPAPAEAAKAHQECVPALVRGKGRRKYRRQRRNRSIHQSRQPGLHNLQHEKPALGDLFVGLHVRGQFLLVEFLGAFSCSRSSLARSSSSCRMLASCVRAAAFS